jgi:8-oxo-dGTP pyrophosphatase MutT (NUDIX family)
MKKKPLPTDRETSAGGVVLQEDSVLLVKVENLQGLIVWTFPKGHLEKGETAAQAALREVREETGWLCRIKKPFGQVRYFFQRNGRLVNKTVRWFLMEPLEKKGESDPNEILDCRWFPLPEAADLLVYKSDREIMGKLKKRTGRSAIPGEPRRRPPPRSGPRSIGLPRSKGK